MTPEQRNLAIWGGAGAAIVAIGWFALSAVDPADAVARADELHGKYRGLYQPDAPASGPIGDQAVAQAKAITAQQEAERDRALTGLVPPLPAEFADGEDLLRATEVLRQTSEQLNKRCAQAGVAPPAWPLSKLDEDKENRHRQLAALHGYASLVRLCLDAGVKGIGAPVIGEMRSDPSGAIARQALLIGCEAPWDAVDRLLQAAREAHGRGLGITDISIELRPDGGRQVSLTASLLLPARPGWQLKPADPGPRAPGATAPRAPASAPAGAAPRPAGGGSGASRL